ncbi:unnamed protein product [Rangifer tarandus platyrhynchus]|uniref:Uncharacterized protein n=1 Tax=Rangifer tarandus platyrhynchus TaxID=3082113 RepID=A0AC59Y2N1_RANTA
MPYWLLMAKSRPWPFQSNALPEYPFLLGKGGHQGRPYCCQASRSTLPAFLTGPMTLEIDKTAASTGLLPSGFLLDLDNGRCKQEMERKEEEA